METRGIVLWEQAYKEHSRLLRVYTEDAGKIAVLAQGVLKRGAKNVALTQPFTRNRYELREGKTFFYVQDGEVEKHYGLERDYTKSLAGSFLMELVDRATEEHNPDARIFHLLDESLEALTKAPVPTALIAFGLRLLRLLGFSASVAGCVACGNTKIRELHYSVEAGGILCENCGHDAMTLTREEYRLFFLLHTAPMASLPALGKVSEQKFLHILLRSLDVHLGLGRLATLGLLESRGVF